MDWQPIDTAPFHKPLDIRTASGAVGRGVRLGTDPNKPEWALVDVPRGEKPIEWRQQAR